MHALVISYALEGATAVEHSELCEQLAPAVAAAPGLMSAMWLANEATGRFGGFYVFAALTRLRPLHRQRALRRRSLASVGP